ncbi:MAG TPA: twin-arginine translocation signal domain-containing protein [Pseudolabrys sp.]|jgi:hypothetical protein|nr:twin-arginine translocation signal domain-containing protein [Pseudolabrys sp.]
MKTEQKVNLARRDFLRVLGAGAGVAATPAVFVSEANADSESADEKTKARYRADSDDVKAFYRVNSYPR